MQSTQDPARTTTVPTVEIALFAGFDELDAIGPWEVLSAAGFTVRAVGFPNHVREIRGDHGITVLVDGPLDGPPGVLIVPGGGWLAGGGSDGPGAGSGIRAALTAGTLQRTVARLHAAGTVVAAVCTGAMALAEAGVLRDRPAVTNRRALDDLRASGADVRDDFRVIDDGDVITCGGPLAGVDLALRVVERFAGTEAAALAAERLDHERRGPLLVTTSDPHHR